MRRKTTITIKVPVEERCLKATGTLWQRLWISIFMSFFTLKDSPCGYPNTWCRSVWALCDDLGQIGLTDIWIRSWQPWGEMVSLKNTWLLINQTWEKPHGIRFYLIMEASFGIGAYAANSIECFQLTSNSNYQKESSFLIIHTNLLNT